MSNVKCISAATLMNQSFVEIIKENGLLRNQAREEDIVWQQMKIEFFEALTTSKSLFFKHYKCYSAYDEPNCAEYNNPVYVSCWYNARQLSDVMFQQFAQKGRGVAIGTDVKTIVQSLENPDDITVCANIQYAPLDLIKNQTIHFSNDKVFAPTFLKPLQFQSEKEFRICRWESKNSNEKAGEKPASSSTETNEATEYPEIVNPTDFSNITSLRELVSRIQNYEKDETCKKCKFHYEEAKEDCSKARNKTDHQETVSIRPDSIRPDSINIHVDLHLLIKYIAIKDDGFFQSITNTTWETILTDALGFSMKYDCNFLLDGYKVFSKDIS